MAGLTALVAVLGLSTLAGAQQSTSYTDTNTGIIFQKYSGDDGGYGFAIALPEDTASTDFIGQLSGDSTATWAGVSLTGQMANSLLIAAFPNTDGTAVLGSLRRATSYSNPSVVTDSGTLTPIADATAVTADGWTYTFLCTGCLADTETAFAASGASAALGMALSTTALQDASAANAVLNAHSGTGGFGVDLDGARSADFATWAALASADTPTTGGSTGNNGTTGTGGNTTTTTPPPVATVSNQTWDYIVAGGGPAGIITATRFAEAGHSVLLLERGPASFASVGGTFPLAWNDSLTPMDIPGLSFHLFNMPSVSTAFCNDVAGMAGCLLGGGTAVNGLQWYKPAQRDFDDAWPAGWQWSDMSAAAERVYERNPGTILSSADGKYYDQLGYDQFVTLLDANGYSSINALEDVDSKDKVYTHSPYNAADGLRSGPVRTYLPLAQQLSNFQLQLDTSVLRVVRNGSAVTGVECELGDGSRQIVNINAGGKVVLASGALSTPRILWRSGIGSAEQIQAVQSGSKAIELPPQADWIDLPVGKYTQDHPNFFLELKVVANNQSAADLTTLGEDDFTNPSQENIDLFARQTGPLTQGSGRIDFFDKQTDEATGHVRYFQNTGYGTADGVVTLMVQLTHGLDSSAELVLTSQGVTEFKSTPWLATEGDRAATEAYMERLLAYMRQPGSNLVPVAGLNVTAASLASKPGSTVHFVGSCRMGEDDGREAGGRAVVDLGARVYGTDNLYIVDASIHPDLPSANTQAPVMVVAEKAAAVILGSDGGSTEGTGTTTGGSSSNTEGTTTGGTTTGGSTTGGTGTGSGAATPSTGYSTGDLPWMNTPTTSGQTNSAGSSSSKCKRGRKIRRGMPVSHDTK